MAKITKLNTTTVHFTVTQFCALRQAVADSRKITIYEVATLWRDQGMTILFRDRGYNVSGSERSMKRFFNDCVHNTMGRGCRSSAVHNALNRIAGAINDPEFIGESGF